MYWGENSVYDDSGYSQFLNASLTITEAQQQLEILQSDDWIDRMTAVVFVEFTLLNPATNWYANYIKQINLNYWTKIN